MEPMLRRLLKLRRKVFTYGARATQRRTYWHDFDVHFTLINLGWEDSAHDSKMSMDAILQPNDIQASESCELNKT